MATPLDLLKIDRVLTAGQMHRHGFELQDLAGIPCTTLTIAPQHMRPALIQTEVVLYAPTLRFLEMSRSSDLGHLIGTAQIRYRLGVLGIPVVDWRVLGPSSAAHLPDAEYTDKNGHLIAVEYDTGTYIRDKIDGKLAAYREAYSGVIWGALSRVRRERIQERNQDISVIDAIWWE